MSAEQLADSVIKHLFNDEEPSFPINPFDIINQFGVVYQFMDFEKFRILAGDKSVKAILQFLEKY